MAGLAITYMMMITDSVSWTVRMVCALDSESVAVERLREYSHLPREADWETESGAAPPAGWPARGEVRVEGVTARHREDLPPALEGLSLTIRPGQKVGVVGRTGAGKSTLASVLLRVVEPGEGRVLLDGLDTRAVGLQQLRSSVTIVPQDSVVFSGSLRFNLDPWGEAGRPELEAALGRIGLEMPLDTQLAEGGANLSLGQRQMVCLGRAVIRRSTLLVLDEATSSLDGEADRRIGQLLKTEFADCSVLTIAHRLSTVLEGDWVCVMDRGRLVEEGKPGELLARHTSSLHQLASMAGLLPGTPDKAGGSKL
jgi:ABC-type multidrug transport system fused ATPase/permease subunit